VAHNLCRFLSLQLHQVHEGQPLGLQKYNFLGLYLGVHCLRLPTKHPQLVHHIGPGAVCSGAIASKLSQVVQLHQGQHSGSGGIQICLAIGTSANLNMLNKKTVSGMKC